VAADARSGRSGALRFRHVPRGHDERLRLRPPAGGRAMSAQRAVPAARPGPLNRLAWLALAGVALAALALLVWGRRAPHQWDVMATPAPVGGRVALVRGRECSTPPCQSLWIGPAGGA